MMQTAPVAATTATPTPTPTSTGEAATNAFGLSFESLLKIILTQLTSQDPLKPMDNFEFVSQLAQFSQIQQSQTTNDQLTALVSAQATTQATGLLGAEVDLPAGAATITGKVIAITFVNGAPRVTLQTADGRTISNISIGSISQVRRGE
jgi:flagellar basal-body rod modification protein FlgD